MLTNYRLASNIIWVTLIAGILQSAYFYPQLPETVATHFNASGNADSFSSKLSTGLMEIALLLFITFLFWGLAKFIPKIPNDLINLPNKEFWLAPERKERTLKTISAVIVWFGIATNIFLILTFQSVIQANLSGNYKLTFPFFIMLITYLIAIIALSIYLILIFSSKKKSSK